MTRAERMRAEGDAALHEILEYAGVVAEEAVHPWLESRRRLNLGTDACGGAFVTIYFEDRRLLNSLKRIQAVRKGVYPGEWVLVDTWRGVDQQAGLASAMADAAAEVLNRHFGERARAIAHGYWS